MSAVQKSNVNDLEHQGLQTSKISENWRKRKAGKRIWLMSALKMCLNFDRNLFLHGWSASRAIRRSQTRSFDAWWMTPIKMAISRRPVRSTWCVSQFRLMARCIFAQLAASVTMETVSASPPTLAVHNYRKSHGRAREFYGWKVMGGMECWEGSLSSSPAWGLKYNVLVCRFRRTSTAISKA